MEITKKDLQNQTKEIQRYNKVLSEDFEKKIKIIGEGWQGIKDKVEKLEKAFWARNEKIDKISVKLDATYDISDKSRKDIEIIKTDISFIKNNLKQKTDKDELEALEKRVLILENKFKRV